MGLCFFYVLVFFRSFPIKVVFAKKKNLVCPAIFERNPSSMSHVNTLLMNKIDFNNKTKCQKSRVRAKIMHYTHKAEENHYC